MPVSGRLDDTRHNPCFPVPNSVTARNTESEKRNYHVWYTSAVGVSNRAYLESVKSVVIFDSKDVVVDWEDVAVGRKHVSQMESFG